LNPSIRFFICSANSLIVVVLPIAGLPAMNVFVPAM
jgi:hypothetical protein